MKYFYIKNEYGDYWHKNKRRWIERREKVPPFMSIEAVHKHIADPTHEINFQYRHTTYNVYYVEVSDEQLVEGLRVNTESSKIYQLQNK